MDGDGNDDDIYPNVDMTIIRLVFPDLLPHSSPSYPIVRDTLPACVRAAVDVLCPCSGSLFV